MIYQFPIEGRKVMQTDFLLTCLQGSLPQDEVSILRITFGYKLVGIVGEFC